MLRPFVLTSAFVLLVVAAPGVSASPSATLSFTKTCPDICTVADSSNTAILPNGSTLTYSGPRFDPHLSSAFVLETPTGTAVGHCQLSWTSGLGHCVIGDGTGSLAGFHAVFSEWVDLDTFVFYLQGTYHIE
jgi:hypothetical protein